MKRLRAARERLAKAVLAVPDTEITGHPTERLPGLLSIIARGTDGAAVSLSLDLEGIATSVGSACTTGSTEVSHVLSAMGYPEDEARGALRAVARPDDHRRRDRDSRRESCRGSSPRCRSVRRPSRAIRSARGSGV